MPLFQFLLTGDLFNDLCHSALGSKIYGQFSDNRFDEKKLISLVDEKIKELNDDYAVERKSALKEVTIKVLPEDAFYQFLASMGKVGAQHKFPRVLKGKNLDAWNNFLKEKKY